MNCPQCDQSDLVDKVSKIYMHAIERKYAHRSKGEQPPEADSGQLKVDRLLNSHDLYSLAKKLAPPSSGKRATFRPIHPDMVVLVFSLIAPLFLFGVATNQPAVFPWLVILLVILYLFYFLKRKNLIARFTSQLQSEKAAEERIQNGIKRWMQLYYCARDEIVFNPLESKSVPVDLLNGYLLQN